MMLRVRHIADSLMAGGTESQLVALQKLLLLNCRIVIARSFKLVYRSAAGRSGISPIILHTTRQALACVLSREA